MDMMNYFLSRLQEGADIEEIAKAATKALNDANTQFKTLANKREAADNLAIELNAFLRDYYPDIKLPEGQGISSDDIISACDNFNSFADLMDELGLFAKDLVDKPVVNKTEMVEDEIQKVLNRFLATLK